MENHEKNEIFHDCTKNIYDNYDNLNMKNSSEDEEIGQDEQIIRNIIKRVKAV